MAHTRDGELVSYRVEGDLGSKLPPIVCANGIGVSTFFWDHLVAHFAPSRAVVVWDYRAHGKSPVPAHPEELTLVQCARDLWDVCDHLGLEQAVLVGHSMGCQVLFEAARLHPERTLALVPMLGASGKVLESFLGGLGIAPILGVLVEIGARQPHLFEQI
ncbi:MAG: alpha/beta fold hydrolase, partial [Deltaproteobacteria bacterium]|nr:alpha/beta fold hydrolase [Deltaproteobacteria bacterium]